MSNFDRVLSHLGHEIEVAAYGDNENVAIECLTCMEVIVDYNQEDDYENMDSGDVEMLQEQLRKFSPPQEYDDE